MTIELGNRLADLRKEHGYSQEELADKLGVSRQAISKWERGEASPDTDNLIELSKIYGVSLDELIGLEKTSSSKEKVNSKINVNINADLNHTIGKDDDDDDDSTIKISKDGIVISDGKDTLHINKGVTINGTKYQRDKRKEKIIGVSSIFTVFGSVIAYILLGSIAGLWAQAWVLFMLIPIIPSLVEAILSKNANHFAYPVFIAFVYLLLCVWILNFSLWHPLWVIFLTIPVYYGIIKLFDYNNN